MVEVPAREMRTFVAGFTAKKISPLVRQLPWAPYRLIMNSGKQPKSVSSIFKTWPVKLQVPPILSKFLPVKK
jgi:hypothetical protein